MTPSSVDLAAPAFNPGAAGLPWHRRALAQGAGYFLPSSLFVVVPLFFTDDWTPATWVGAIACLAAILVFFLGTTLVLHWPEAARWVWLAGLMCSIAALGLVTGGGARPWYFAAFVTSATALLIAWPHARIVIVLVSLACLGISARVGDMFGVVMAVMAFAVGWGIGSGIETDRTRERLRRAEERTAVLAVAAERERIARDLHDILGHSLTTIAVQADLAGRLVGRDDDAARAEIGALAAVARQSLADVRATASGMREVRLATEIAASRSVLDAAGIEAATPSALPALPDSRSELFGYVVREAVTNVVRHAGAVRCTITCDESGVSVSDDGRGIPAGAQGSGLSGLRRRVEDAGAHLVVQSSTAGSTITAHFEETP